MSAAQNLAVAHVRHALIAVTDDDCVPAADWVERAEALLNTASGNDFVAGRVEPLDPEGDRVFPVASRTSDQPRAFRGKSTPWDVGSGNNFALKREWFVAIGGCDERLGPGAPGKGAADMDLFYRLLRAGARGSFEPDLAVRHARQTRQGRLDRRLPYGYGIGACSVMYVRDHDWYGLRLLACWFMIRVRQLTAALVHGQWMRAHELQLTLQGTLRGIVFGLRIRQPAWERVRHSHLLAVPRPGAPPSQPEQPPNP
jgi:hypothetical protein